MARVIVGREIRFSAAHCLPHVPKAHKCSRLHGHSYRVAVEVSRDVDPLLGWVVDFGHVDIALRQLVHDALDHRYLNEIPGLENPTSEVLTEWVRARLALALEALDGLRITSVSVHEGDGGGWARLELP